ncbi:MAG: hypothetical protein GXY49_03465 [Syntrophomonadaceae bacterium]|nr:hypothetical protein [Syntrophomonadaceae bacterium]
MIFAEDTPNHTGVAIYGDHLDFQNLYEALHTVVGEEEEFYTHHMARLRVLGVCYDIRHAMMGDREIEFVDGGMDAEKRRRMMVLAPDKNVYLKIYVLWPEILFVVIVLNDFIRLYAKKKAKQKYDIMTDRHIIWDESISMVRVLQAALAKCIRETVSETSYNRMMGMMNSSYNWFNGYATQYLDILNCRFIDMKPEKKLKNIPIMAKRITECGEEYQIVKAHVAAAAKQYNTYEDNISAAVEYPDDFDW